MSDVFISYAREDREAASRLAARLTAEGWTVFWDSHVHTGDDWARVIEAEVTQACSVVALFSVAANRSEWVKKEAEIGTTRGVLVPALLGVREPPPAFRRFQASDLTGWDGRSDTDGLTRLVRAVTALCGGRKSVALWPLKLFIVVGWPSKWPGLGPTVNMDTGFVNELGRTVSVRWLEASAAGPNALVYRFTWKVPYDRVGLTEHVRQHRPVPAIDLPPGRTEQGIQLQAPAFSETVTWPSGQYSFEVLGWTDHKRGEPANVKTRFQVSVSDYEAAQVKWLMEADDTTWTGLKASDDAMGVEVAIGDVRTGLPTV